MRRLLLALILVPCCGFSQQFIFPDQSGWTQIDEGRTLSFDLKLSDKSQGVRFVLDGANGFGMNIDSLGRFTWTPSYDLVDRIEKQKEINVIFQAEVKDNKKIRQPVHFVVHHVNRPPVVEELPTFYVKQNTPTTYQIPAVYVHDPDGDPVLFRARESLMPEGAQLTSLGQVSWTPSRIQFYSLKTNPLAIEFIVQDQPDKAETVGRIRIAQTQQDLPPELLIVPGDTILNIRENEVVYLKVYIADPNGDDNIDQVDFISSDPRVPRSIMKQNSISQREFTWTPGYNFVDEAEGSREVLFTFFAFDKSNNRVQRKVRIKVNETENVEEKDKMQYQKYYNSLAAAKNMMDLLDGNSDKLESTYNKAKKGKKKRTILTASLGLVTGVSPLVLEPDPAKAVTVVGGTSVLTINSLEAGQVIGRSANEYQNKIKANNDLKTQLQLKGNYFARKYALKSARRGPDFESDRDEITRLLNSDAIVALELPASQQEVPSEKSIKKTFTDFGEE